MPKHPIHPEAVGLQLMCYSALMEMMENRKAVYHITTATTAAIDSEDCR